MAVYERTYKPYTGALTPEWSRFLVVPNYAFREVFQKKLLLAFFAICFVWPLILAVLIYLPHNSSFLKLINQQTGGSGFFSMVSRRNRIHTPYQKRRLKKMRWPKPMKLQQIQRPW